MYGGNGKSPAEIISEVKQTVIGQDVAVEWLCKFVHTVCERSRMIREQSFDPISLPSIGSALLVGPTASGKTHLVKTFARVAGVLFHSIDAGQMSGEGYKGNNFSIEWANLVDKLDANPDRNALVFIDEVDKLYSQRREGWAGFDLLKPLEGGMLRGMSPHSDSSWVLDCDRCIFVLAGAFTGIEQFTSRRLSAGVSSVGFSASGGSSFTKLSENELRERVTLDDIEEWGMPREIVGRLSTIKFLRPLGEDALRMIIRCSKQDEYSAMLPGDAKFLIDSNAEDVLVRGALAAPYGARYINRKITDLFIEIMYEIEDARPIKSITLTACGDELDFRIEKATSEIRSVAAAPREDDRLSAGVAYGLLREVRERVAADGGLATIDPHVTLGEDCSQYAAALLCQGNGVVMREEGPCIRNDFSLAEIALLYALLSMLRDWFPTSDQTPHGLRLLLSLADPKCASNSSALDLLFYQIETGKRYIPDPQSDSNGSSPQKWVWADSLFVRTGDDARPADTNGLKPSEDSALGYYSEFKGYPRESQRQSVSSLAFRLL